MNAAAIASIYIMGISCVIFTKHALSEKSGIVLTLVSMAGAWVSAFWISGAIIKLVTA